MEHMILDVSHYIEPLCKQNGKCNSELHGFLSKQIWSPQDRQDLLNKLSRLFLLPECTLAISQTFRPLILDIVERCKNLVSPEEVNFRQYQKFCVALSKVISKHPDVLSFTLGYLQGKPAFFDASGIEMGPTSAKRAKKSKDSRMGAHELMQACVNFLKIAPAQFRGLWDWSSILEHLQSNNVNLKWCVCICCVKLLNMSDGQASTFLRKHLTQQQLTQVTIRNEDSHVTAVDSALLLSNPSQQDWETGQQLSHTVRGVTDIDLSDSVVSVCGVLLPVLTQPPDSQQTTSDLLVRVTSTQSSLRSLALAVASSSPVLLQGPVGCGKTMLVEHLASVTGHHKTPHLMKIQLGDQTDSKALLGTYRCTDIPGEFVWQAGSLTQAVTQGHWILLEDIDYAPMDVISVLVPILESGTLSLPGHGDEIRAAPGFRLFATQRLLGGGISGYYKQNASSMLLEKLWTRINVEPLSREELEQVITSRYPALSPIVDRLLNIYFLLSAGRHEVTTEVDSANSDADSVGKFLSNDGRMISTRDLMKWCSRIAVGFDVSSSATGNKVFQEALDIFCACLSKPEKRLPLAEAMGARLNITKVKAEYYCEKYKPNIEISPSAFTVGRASLSRKNADQELMKRVNRVNFAFTRQAVSLLERVSVCVARNEPVLLVGETGTGKTSSVQYLAHQMGHTLRVVNMNQQSDSTDLLGGFKPIDVRCVITPVREEFEILFCRTFSRKQNAKFLSHIQACFSKRRWLDLFRLMEHTQQTAVKKFEKGSDDHVDWHSMGKRLRQVKTQVKHAENALAFSFIEGTLVKALNQGDWVLLDEINLATAETLECLSGLLESSAGSIVLSERGDVNPITRHEDFRLFACMNPATDVGKKDLPPGIRNRFTEMYVDELTDTQDLKVLTADYLKGLSLTANQLEGIVRFYLHIKNEAVKKLTDGTGHKPHYSLRTLCRALRQAAGNPCGNVLRSLYEGFCLSFLTQLDRSSHPLVEQLISQHVVGKSNMKSILKQSIPAPSSDGHLLFEGYWVAKGNKKPHTPENYVLTQSVRANLRDLVRVVSAGRYPVLLQGETSVGKTSLVQWLAEASGNHCVRVNNHEHTDLQEYVGSYSADENGKLIFKEGVLVDAMRKGHWIILDELNLAPTDVLEALNRLLDDNRELFIPETQETVKAHSKFMLFATQNPPGQYGGRKVLSRAFRNRFVELHFDEIPSKELEQILHQRCSLPQSYCKKLVAVLLELWTRRRGSGVFAGKQGYITLRDLFRWAERYHLASSNTSEKFYDWDQHLAYNGYMLLAGRVRRAEECLVIQEIIEKHLKRKVDPNDLFTLTSKTSMITDELLKEYTSSAAVSGFEHLVWTYSTRRLAVLVGQALKFGEPVLLVGDTGCGKTTVCQLFAAKANLQLYSVNCHQHTESGDFLGGLRPIRHRQDDEDSESQKLFEWCDGPLVQAMQEGAMLLIDEISLTDDSVLERLNSVLEPERKLLLAEKGSGMDLNEKVDELVAKETFRIFATMNPGGDFGKKELSPALRNRFTEIWCPQSNGRADLTAIIEHNLKAGIHLCNQEDGTSGIGSAIMDFVEWFSNNEIGKRSTVSIRDILSWVHFINTCSRTVNCEDEVMDCDDVESSLLESPLAYIHGACLVFLDALGSGVTSSIGFSPAIARSTCLKFLCKQIADMTGHSYDLSVLGLKSSQTGTDTENRVKVTESKFGIPPFFIPRGERKENGLHDYALHAPTTCLNAQRVLRAMQLNRPILLEGSPGVGKTSLVAAIAKASGHELVRINLSEQTDVSDLFGADLPVEGAEGGHFAWRDGPLLQALKAGHWIVLDELNLASQSVLEGLNACLDHRAEVYVPELGMTFQVQHEKTRLFACQNPLNQGGGRKGLPKSFLNRFTQVFVEPLSAADLQFITQTLYPTIPMDNLQKMIEFNNKVYTETTGTSQWGQRGAPWEFNLRDIFRWCDLLLKNQTAPYWNPGEYVSLIYADRMRTEVDKKQVKSAFKSVFGEESTFYESGHSFHISSGRVQVGHSFLGRLEQAAYATNVSSKARLKLLHHILPSLESLIKVIEMNWMAILVGPSCSGKTSVVQLLAQLVGQKLQILPMNSAMDTTELLGGFEQADIKRHLEAVNEKIWTVADTITRWLLCQSLEADFSQVKQAMRLCTKYRKLCATVDEVTSNEEAQCLQQKFSVAKQLLNHLLSISQKHPECPHSETLQRLLSQIEVLERRFSVEGSVNGGGQFEWVDSTLVQALREGHWLLIDNVNFCSPSVLDRLNALLEPHGVLTINERGVIDGQIPTIVPHPDFRLILSMDPQHGEISRAMRNRGVEIYILGESEGGHYDDFDTRQMLQSMGLVGRVVHDVLITVHNEVRETVVSCDHHTLLDLLHTALLTRQQLERGVDLCTALTRSAVSVYVSGQRTQAAKEQARAVVQKHIGDLNLQKWETDNHDSCLVEMAHWPTPVPSVVDYHSNAAMATVRHNGIILLNLLEQLSLGGDIRSDLKLTLHELSGSGKPVIRPGEPAVVPRIRTATWLAIEQLSPKHWETAEKWLLSAVKQRMGHQGTADVQTEHGVQGRFTSSLLEVIDKVTAAMFTHPLMHQLRTGLEELASSEEENFDLEEQPFDLRWNALLLNKIAKKKDKGECRSEQTSTSDQSELVTCNQWKQERDSQWERLFCINNQLLLVGWLTELSLLRSQTTASKQSTGSRNTSLLQLSSAFHQGVVELESLPHVAVTHLYPFFELLDKNLLQIFQNDQHIDDASFIQVQECLFWLLRFTEFCLERVSVKSSSFVPHLMLHWIWVYNKTLVPLFSSERPMSAELQGIVGKLHGILGSEDVATKMQLKLWSAMGHPHPPASHLLIQLLPEVIKMTRTFPVETEELWVTSRQKLLDMYSLLFNLNNDQSDLEHVEEKAQILMEELRKLMSPKQLPSSCESRHVTSAPEVTQSAASMKNMLPIHEHLGVLTYYSHVTKLMQDEVTWKNIMGYVEHGLVHTGISPSHYTQLQVLTINQSKDLVRCCLPVLLVDLHTLSRTSSLAKLSSLISMPAQTDALEKQTRERDSEDLIKAPDSIYSPLLSFVTFCILTETRGGKRVSRQTSADSLMPSSIYIDSFTEKLGELKSLSSHLWMHATNLSSFDLDVCYNERKIALQSFAVLLKAIFSILPESQIDIFPKLAEEYFSVSIDRRVEILKELSQVTTVYEKLFPNFGEVLKGCLDLLSEVAGKTCPSEHPPATQKLVNTFLNGSCFAHVGLLQAHLLAPKGPVDPAEKQALKLHYVNKEIENVEIEFEVRNRHNQVLVGHDIDLVYSHPHLQNKLTKLTALKSWKSHLSTMTAVRPTPPQYDNILRSVNQYLSSIGSYQRVTFVIKSLQGVAEELSSGKPPHNIAAVLMQAKSWLSTQDTFIKQMQSEYPLYTDIVMPFLSGVAQLTHGIMQMVHVIQTQHTRMQLYRQAQIENEPDLLELVVSALGQMPSLTQTHPSSLTLSRFLSSDHVIRLVTQALEWSSPEGPLQPQTLGSIKKVMWSALLHLRNYIISIGELTSPVLQALSTIFHSYVVSWREAENRKKEREAEESSLYRYKTETHGSELTEEEQDEVDLRENFPSFDQDFEDIVAEQTLDDKPVTESTQSENGDTVLEELSAQEIADIGHVHNEIFSTLTQTQWLSKSTQEPKLSYVEAFLSGYQVAADMVKNTAAMLSSDMDSRLLGGHLLSSAVLQNSVQMEGEQKLEKLQCSRSHPYDIYHDPNVSEVIQCRPILNQFLSRVKELLAEWPDHPALKQITAVINRILSFSITSPLMKFLTGLEVLLEKSQEWEKNASKQVSIQTQLDSVTQLVIQWRRLELRCWKGCLDVTQWKAAEKAWHFWFHIYQLVESFTNPEEESSIHDLKKGLIKAIQQFMESSTLGEYHTRLQLIQAFHCQAVHMDPSSRQEILLNLLWNSHQYYSQFIPAVDAVITRLRTPIEKDLKGFVKIARWTDINFWAMKQAAEKTHRTLHKQMKKFESVLRQPVSPILTEGKEKEESHARSDEGHEEVVKVTNKDYLSSESVQEVVSDAADQGEADSILSRLPSLYLKMRKLCRRILQADNHCKHVDVVNEFTGDIISSVQELQAMQVTEGTDKEKQKKEAKHIHQRKRKALADLFKYLSKIGLSYRKGLGAWNHADDTSMAAMLTDPVDVTVALKSLNETSGCDTQTVNAWRGCQSYFIRCLVRRALYHTSLNTPSQELGVANLDRCRGFSEHLMTLTLTQKSELAKTVQEFVSVRNLVDSVKLASRVNSSARPGLPPQSALRQWVDELKLAADQAYESAKQFEILLHCCPPGDEGVVTCPSPLPREELAQVACMRRGDEMWTRVNQLVHDVLKEVCSLKSWYGTICSKGSQIFTWSVYEQLRTQFDQLTGLVPVIDSIVELFMQPKTSELSALTECLSVTKQHIISQSESFLCWFKQTDQVSCHNDVLPSTNERIQKEMTTIDGDLESIVVDMLLVIQKLLKGQGQKQTEDTAKENGGDENEDEDEEELLDGILVDKTHNSLSYHWTILSLDKKLKSLQMLVTKIKTYSDQGEVMLTTHLQNLLSRCIPVMDQFVRMTQFYLTQSIASHRSTSKLLSVLLGIFTELTLKGFCLPAEYSDEMAGEGAGQFEDIEGDGMGEGEGMKDVSDQIENEDQLDEARKAGEEKDPEDTSQQPDIKEEDNGIEMSEDFDGKLHDLEPTEGEEGESDEEDKNEENELDKQMGDVDDNNADKLDDQVWGSDDEDDQQENEDSKEESGPGSGKQSEPELVAKDDNEDKTETGPEHGREEQKNEEEDSEKEPKQQELENIDESEYDENQVDPHYGDQQKQEEVQPMDLPDDLNLDEEEEGGDQKDGTAEQEENPFDIDKVAEQEDEEKGKEEEESREEEAENDGKDEGMDVDDKDDTLKEGEEKEPEQSNEDPASTDKQDDDAMDTEEANPEDAEKKEDSGFEPQEDKDAGDQNRPDNQDKAAEEKVESADQMSGQTDHTADSVEQSDTAQDRSTAVSQDDHEEEGAGQADSEDQKGHEGQTSSAITRGGTAQEDRQQTRQKPGQSNVDRSLGSAEEKVHRRLKTTDTSKQQKDDEKDNRQEDADLYEHVKDAASHHDAQTLDAATADQEQQQQPVVSMEDEETEQDEMTDEDVQMRDQEQKDEQASESKDKVSASKLKPEEKNADMEDENGEGEHKVEIEGEAVATHNVQRPHVSTIHTDMDVFMDKSTSEHDIEILRSELEQHMSSWSQPARGSLQEEQAALEAWHQYEALTSNLSQELCEQLRLVLEPSQATKLKGDYRTGKRLNMRKVIPYIASQFRKDKIWLRRTKPHKRQYQIMIAIDDSSSMMDNHSKQLAFESLSVVANALTLLEAGELGICSFGETVELLHPFHEQFSTHSGSRILQRFTFEQKKTKIAELLHKVTGIMLNARRSPRGSVTQGDISQLLLIVSDGRGLFLEGMEVVRLAVRQAREANVFLVFVIIDNLENKDSILDIRVPFFKAVGQIPEIHSYMDHFPFPFYIILRDINSLPHTLSDALRQWFELVTAADK